MGLQCQALSAAIFNGSKSNIEYATTNYTVSGMFRALADGSMDVLPFGMTLTMARDVRQVRLITLRRALSTSQFRN